MDAQYYCQNTCNSDLVSIHNKWDYVEIVGDLELTVVDSSTNFWIGLNGTSWVDNN